MSELKKLADSVHRVLRAFKGLYNLRDLSDEVRSFKDTLKKSLNGKFAAISIEEVVKRIIAGAKSLQINLELLPGLMEDERIDRNKNKTLKYLVFLKEDLVEIRSMSLSLPVSMKSAVDIMSAMRTRIDKALRGIQKCIDEVKLWR